MDVGMARPSVLAVLRLITNSNLVACSTGKSPGLAPEECGRRRCRLDDRRQARFWSVAHQIASLGVVS